MPRPASWDEADDARLLALHKSGLTALVIGERMGRSESAISARLTRLGRTGGGRRPSTAWAGWTLDAIETLHRLAREGLTASQIALALGAPSRNAVIAKLHRTVGSGALKGRNGDQVRVKRATADKAERTRRTSAAALRREAEAGPPRPAPVRGPRPPALVLPGAPPPPDMVDPAGVRLEHLPPGACRWPVGVDARGVIVFCAAPGPHEGPYCTHHAAKARASVQPARPAPDATAPRRKRRPVRTFEAWELER